ncbi:MAG: nicotinate (nicotinamide) nucleotide adenylyltransferase [Clostridia bacterium]|nr:nicotinate (nicotinamide) nucleotide adenylyltransferase [Clostridia bacterium]
MAERIGIYGGTFSPPHNGHVGLAKTFCREFRPDRLLIIPDSLPPHKELPDGAGSVHRLEMARLAFEDIESASVSDFEISREGEKSYSYDTVRHFKKNDNVIYLLCGTDMLLTFDRWYRFKDLFEMCELVYAYRNSDDPDNEDFINAKIAEYREKYGAVIHKLGGGINEISSSQIRIMISEGGDASEFLPEKVYDYIKANGLYKNG